MCEGVCSGRYVGEGVCRRQSSSNDSYTPTQDTSCAYKQNPYKYRLVAGTIERSIVDECSKELQVEFSSRAQDIER